MGCDWGYNLFDTREKERERERERERTKDRETDRQTEGQTDRVTHLNLARRLNFVSTLELPLKKITSNLQHRTQEKEKRSKGGVSS